MTPVFCCGFECGVASTGGAGSLAGSSTGTHWDITGTGSMTATTFTIH